MERIGKYKIIKELGAGGFGAVYLAQDPKLSSVQVAIKVFQVKDENVAGAATSASTDAAGVLKKRFMDEAETLHKLSANPYIVNIRDYDEMPDGTPYYVMPYLPKSLETEIGKDAFSRGKLEDTPKHLHPRKLASQRAMVILEQILDALSAVHQAGLVHRDIKPANILFDEQNNVQLCDFGIAKLPDAEHSQSGVGMGSRNYMSPEQRESAKHVMPASDVYSVGVVAYRMFTGQLPIGKYQDMVNYCPELGQPLNDLIESALSQHEEQRPQDGSVFLQQFKQALKGVSETAQEEDEATGTWIDEGNNTTNIKAELKPLQDKITEILLREGEVPQQDYFQLEALAAIAGLDKTKLDSFIQQTSEQLAPKLKPLQNWLALVKQKAQAGDLDDSTSQVLISAASNVGLIAEKASARLSSIKAQYEQKEDKQELKFKEIEKNVKTSPQQFDNSKAHVKHRNKGVSKTRKNIGVIILIGIICFFVYAVNQGEQNHLSKQKSINDKSAINNGLQQDKEKYTLQNAKIPLTINPTPSDAKVQILNIQPQYYDGIKLKAGEYQIKVSKTGYNSKTQWITLNQANTQYSIILVKEVAQNSVHSASNIEAFKRYLTAAEQGNAEAQFIIGAKYKNGEGVVKDGKRAMDWFRKSAEQGYAFAQFSLGVGYDGGLGVAQDDEQAVVWYRKAAKQGYAPAQNTLGFMYKRGEGVPQDHDQAVTWYRKAAEQDYVYAQYNLGLMFELGKGVAQDDNQAVVWYRKAAEQGHANAIKALKRRNLWN
ncbi:serine/threonine-protein kinase [uncultured Paraglaciecola sp.]|uniref:serine/threonine-protein kinase n=1 Tax=uncultured Paraglaciecola sp. TaxID=1765024 RepID=UPI00263980C7|nr:serine/threonine-protein kinase [uncultured Paraglaciecola sp.]